MGQFYSSSEPVKRCVTSPAQLDRDELPEQPEGVHLVEHRARESALVFEAVVLSFDRAGEGGYRLVERSPGRVAGRRCHGHLHRILLGCGASAFPSEQ